VSFVEYAPADARIAHELLGQLTKQDKTWSPDVVPASLLREIITAVEGGKINGTTGRNVLKHVVGSGSSGKNLDALLQDLGLVTSDSASSLADLCQAVIAKLPKEADKVRKGNEKVVMRLVGEVMKMSKGTADAKVAHATLLDLLRPPKA
jgi:aspartyl-tRNA(Asn)/glutamyl-tRNA(Gln) amidotransferase subunit B